MSIEENVASSKRVRELVEYLDADGFTEQSWRVLRDVAISRAPLPVRDETHIRPMSDDDDGRKFGHENLNYGTFADCSYEHVYNCDLNYLNWIADRGMLLLKWLAWRKSKR